LEQGLLPLSQTALLVAGDIAFHEYEGVAVNLEERARLVADLGDKNVMLLRNHGTLTLGGSVAEAFTTMYFLETACAIQVRALGMGRPLHPVSSEAIDRVAQMQMSRSAPVGPDLVWPALLRKLDRLDPGWDGQSVG
jgi:ribulose-5-phosphate 4-epimerase/fuculose-1-phosphate aldolase